MNDTGDDFPVNDPLLPGYISGVAPYWEAALTNFGVTDQLRLCPVTRQPTPPIPNAPMLGTADLAWVQGDAGFPSLVGSYCGNGWITREITAYPAVAAYQKFFFNKPSSVQRPVTTPLFSDANFAGVWPLESDPAAADLYIGQNTPSFFDRQGMGCCTILRHGGPTATSSVKYTAGQPLPGAINMGFDDGHGELVKLQSLWTYDWHLNW